MSYLKATATERLQLPSDPDYWVEMKLKASHGDASHAQRAMAQVTSVDLMAVDPRKAAQVVPDEDKERGVLTEIDIAAYSHALLERLIVDWNLTDLDERKLPITAASMELLDQEDGEYLSKEARKRLKRRKGPFVGTSGAPQSDGKQTIPMPSKL